MREIKFRARRVGGSQEWVYFTLKSLLKVHTLDMNGTFKDWCEHTGLKDKNGKEIYEGDILRDDVRDLFEVKFGILPLDKSGDCVCTYQAFYAKGYGRLGSPPYHECQEIGEWMEIIGNIYENPELLKE